MVKLTYEFAVLLREMFATGNFTPKQLSRELGFNYHSVLKCLRGKTWKEQATDIYEDKKWKVVIGYKGLYSVSDDGLVRSDKTEKIVAQWGKRYNYVTLYKNNQGENLSVHRIVAEAFVANPSNYPYVLHNDGNNFNNLYSNLRWGTQSHNLLDAMEHGTWKKPPTLRGSTNPKATIDEDKAAEIKRLLSLGYSQQRIANSLGVSRSLVRDIKLEKSWRHVDAPRRRESQGKFF